MSCDSPLCFSWFSPHMFFYQLSICSVMYCWVNRMWLYRNSCILWTAKNKSPIQNSSCVFCLFIYLFICCFLCVICSRNMLLKQAPSQHFQGTVALEETPPNTSSNSSCPVVICVSLQLGVYRSTDHRS